MKRKIGRRLTWVCMLLVAVVLGAGTADLVGQGSTMSPSQGQQTASSSHAAAPARYTLPPEKLAQAIAYSRARTVLYFAEQGLEMLLLLLLLTSGAAAWMQQRAESAGRNRWVQAAVFSTLLLGINRAFELPLDLYRHHLAVKYGQSVQGWASWSGDQAKSFGLTLGVGVLMILLLFRIVRWSPRRWWFWFWAAAVIASAIAVFIWPVLVDPLFNRFEPLSTTSPALVEQLEHVVHRGGINIPPNRMFLMRASDKVTGLNAYVTGFGATKRVVVWDTTVQKAKPEEISFIFAHEMGHYVLNHIYLGLSFSAGLMLATFWLAYCGVQFLLRRFRVQWRIASQGDWSMLVVLMLVGSVISFAAEPVANAFSRWEEHAADVYGQEAMHGILANPQTTGAETFQLLGEQSLTDPTPSSFVEFWTYSHPSVSERMAFASAYDPWVAGKSPRYFKR